MMSASRGTESLGSRGSARPEAVPFVRAIAIAAVLLLLASMPAASARAQEVVTSPEFAGGVKPGAVFDDKGFFDAARRCGEKFSFAAYPADADGRQKDCLAAYMARHRASPQAIAFMNAAPVPAAISEIRHYGPVSVVRANMMWADGSDGWALVGDSGEIIPLWTPPKIGDDPRWRRFLGRHPGVSLWSDSMDWPKGRPFGHGAESLTFRFALKTCHACARVGEAIVEYDFSARGEYGGAHLVRIAANVPAR